MKWRVSQEFSRLYNEWSGQTLTATNICPSDETDFGAYAYDTDSFTADSTTPATTGRGGIQAKVVTKGAAEMVLNAVCNLDDAATANQKTISVTIAGSAPVNTSYTLGEQVLTGNTAVGATSIPLAATSQFLAGRQVLVYDTASQEIVTVTTVLGASLVVPALRHAYTTAATATVRPLFDGVQSVTRSSGGNAGDVIDFFVKPDTTPAL